MSKLRYMSKLRSLTMSKLRFLGTPQYKAEKKPFLALLCVGN